MLYKKFQRRAAQFAVYCSNTSTQFVAEIINEALPGWGSHVACLNFKTSRVAIWPEEVVSCRDFILRAVATFWAMSLVGIYPGKAS